MRFLKPNIGVKGRVFRAIGATALCVGGILAIEPTPWLGLTLLVSSAFVLFEAVRGWCLLRACGIKTKF